MAGDAGEGGGEVVVGDVLDGDLDVGAVGAGGVVEDVAGIVFAVGDGDVRDAAAVRAEREAPRRYFLRPFAIPSVDLLDRRREDRHRRNAHLNIRPRREDGSAHPTARIILILRQYPLRNPALPIVMTRPVLGIIPALLVHVVEVAVHEEADPAVCARELVRAHGPVHLRLLAAVEAVDVDEGAVAAAEAGAQVGLGGEGALHELDVAEVLKFAGAGGGRVAREDAAGVLFVADEAADDGHALGAGAADDEDFGGLVLRGRHFL